MPPDDRLVTRLQSSSWFLALVLLLVLVVRLATPAAELISTFWIAISVVAFLILFLLVGLAPVIVGYGFKQRKRWVKPVGLALALVSLINIPVGTALGIYTFKFFRSEGGAKLYGGKVSTADNEELTEAMRRAQPLMNWAKRSK